MGAKLTRTQRAFLTELRDEGSAYWLPSATRAMARRLNSRGLCSFTPETVLLSECWSITKRGEAALALATPSPDPTVEVK